MERRFKGKIGIVTGGAKGIGRATVVHFFLFNRLRHMLGENFSDIRKLASVRTELDALLEEGISQFDLIQRQHALLAPDFA